MKRRIGKSLLTIALMLAMLLMAMHAHVGLELVLSRSLWVALVFLMLLLVL